MLSRSTGHTSSPGGSAECAALFLRPLRAPARRLDGRPGPIHYRRCRGHQLLGRPSDPLDKGPRRDTPRRSSCCMCFLFFWCFGTWRNKIGWSEVGSTLADALGETKLRGALVGENEGCFFVCFFEFLISFLGDVETLNMDSN